MQYNLFNWRIWRYTYFLLLIFMLSMVGISNQAKAQDESIELCSAIDGSDSIPSEAFTLQLEGLAKAIVDPAIVPQNGLVTISVVHFASSAKVVIPPTRIGSQEVANQIAARILAINQSDVGEFTDIAEAIELCSAQFSHSSDLQVIDISTDGNHNESGDPIAAANSAEASGVDAINALGIGQLEIEELRQIVRPQPANTNTGQPGFVVHVPSFNEYTSAIRAKIAAETGQILPKDSEYPSSVYNLGNGKCLDVYAPELGQEGAKVQIWDCNGNVNQQWVLRGNQLQNAAGQCLDVPPDQLAMDGGRVQMWSCNGTPSQQWQLIGTELKNAAGLCLDITDLYTNGAQAQVRPCNGQINQQWQANGSPLVNGGGFCLDAPATANGTEVHIWGCHGGKNQRWTLNGTQLINDEGKCLDVHAAETNINGGRVQVWDCNGQPNQQWRLTEEDLLINIADGKCLDVDAARMNSNGGRVQVWDCNGNTNQLWTFFTAAAINGTGEAGSISGVVRDVNNLGGLFGTVATVYDQNRIMQNSATTNSSGSYMVNQVPSQQKVWTEFTRDGYWPVQYYNIMIEPRENHNLEQVLMIPTSYSGVGTATGTVINAVTGDGLEDVTVRFRSGMNATEGPVVAETVTNSDGLYEVDLETGHYTIEADKAGFELGYATVISLGGETRANQNVIISPALAAGEVRIVLSWRKAPDDLDSHLTGPVPGTFQRFHTFWYPDNKVLPYANLDVDDVYQYGPETITATNVSPQGVYRYSVHDYTNRESDDSFALGLSGAQVRIYATGGLVAVFNVPNEEGTLWTVFEVIDGRLTAVNSMSYESDTHSVRSRDDASLNDAHLINDQPEK